MVSEKYLTLLDRFVLDFIRVLEQETPYVIVSGYVAILFGRSRVPRTSISSSRILRNHPFPVCTGRFSTMDTNS